MSIELFQFPEYSDKEKRLLSCATWVEFFDEYEGELLKYRLRSLEANLVIMKSMQEARDLLSHVNDEPEFTWDFWYGTNDPIFNSDPTFINRLNDFFFEIGVTVKPTKRRDCNYRSSVILQDLEFISAK